MLRKARLRLKLSQSEVAAKIGVSTTFYAHLERGRKSIPMFRAKKVSRALKIDLQDIFEGIRKFKGIRRAA